MQLRQDQQNEQHSQKQITEYWCVYCGFKKVAFVFTVFKWLCEAHANCMLKCSHYNVVGTNVLRLTFAQFSLVLTYAPWHLCDRRTFKKRSRPSVTEQVTDSACWISQMTADEGQPEQRVLDTPRKLRVMFGPWSSTVAHWRLGVSGPLLPAENEAFVF